ncbi:MAG: hypothetical protein ACKPEQ_10085, partial [Dolichospermum sp.]
ECKHQIAVSNFLASQVEVVSPTGFGYYEAVVGDINNTIATIEYHSDRDCDQSWWSVRMATKKSEIFASYEESEQFIKNAYTEDYISNGRGSGRISEPVEDMGMTIEDIHYQDGRGSQYLVRLHGSFAGYIWLNNDCWTLNGVDFEDDWRPVAKELARLTKHLVAA